MGGRGFTSPRGDRSCRELVGAATQVLGQGFAIVLGEHAGRAAVDELVQIGRIAPDGARGHPKVGTALLDPCEDAPTNRIHSNIVFSHFESRFVI